MNVKFEAKILAAVKLKMSIKLLINFESKRVKNYVVEK
jgi:hypothetical protein